MELILEDVRSGYGDAEVVRGVSIRISSGTILGVLGRNGMGKSTLIRTIAGLNRLRTGRIVFGGHDISNMPAHARAKLGVSTIVQGRGMFPLLTVRENLEMGRLCGGRRRASRQSEVLDYFPRLGERLDQLAGTMSGGEQQMLAIARSLMSHPKLILLDEPSDGIMPVLVDQIAEIIAKISQNDGLSVMIVEQNVPMVFRMTDKCVIIEGGKVVASGERDDLEQSGSMRKYLAI